MIPKFHSGQTLKADDLNALVAEIAAVRKIAESALLRDVSGATFSRSAAGTTLSIPPPPRRRDDDEEASAPQRHPFKVEVLDVGGRRTLGVFEPWVYVLSTGASPLKRVPTTAGGFYGELGAQFALLPTPPPGRHSLSLNVRHVPGHWMVEGGDGDGGAQPFYSEIRGMSGLSLDWDDGFGNSTERLSFHVADVTRSVDEAGAESFAVVQHLRSTPFIPVVLPDQNKLTTAS